jgi:DNA-binding CsgD family transcriptional regulator
MYLNSEKAQALSKIMQVLAEPQSEAQVREQVGGLLLNLLDADYFASYVWDDAERCFQNRVALNMSDKNLATYESYFQYRDPITPLMQRRHEPTRVIQVMPQHDLVRTEFFNDFLMKDGLYWGVNVYAWDRDQNIGDMRIWRNKRRDDFDDTAMTLLRLIQPAFTTALKRSRSPATTGSIVLSTSQPSLTACLSERERQILDLIALGWPDKEIARRLGIGFTTVRTHVTHIFRKLGVDNRVQLVRLAQGA